MPGVSAVSVDLAAGIACVHAGKGAGCPTMFVRKILAALEEGGYPARVEGAEGGVEAGGSETGGGMSSHAPFQVADGGCEGGGSAPGIGGEWGLDVNWEQVSVAKTRETHTAPGAALAMSALLPSNPVVLALENMTCGKCVGRVHRALVGLPGVCSVTVDLAAGRAQVEIFKTSKRQLVTQLCYIQLCYIQRKILGITQP